MTREMNLKINPLHGRKETLDCLAHVQHHTIQKAMDKSNASTVRFFEC